MKRNLFNIPDSSHNWVQFYGWNWKPKDWFYSEYWNHYKCSDCGVTAAIPNERNSNTYGWSFKPPNALDINCNEYKMKEALE